MSDVIQNTEGGRRAVKAIPVVGVEPTIADAPPPSFREVDPAALLVDDGYQRNLSERSVTLIRKIVGAWDWRRFKPPVCAETDQGLEVIDGQHTAIAAASHPAIHTIPVMVVVAAERSDRAQSFIGHNRDRVNITPMQMHFAAAAAGDEDALTINQVCERAGVTVLKSPPGNGIYKPGDTVAVRAIGALINRRGVIRAREVLQLLVGAKCAPVAAGQIKAVECLLHDGEFKGEIDAEAIASVLLAGAAAAEQEAAVFAATHGTALWKALAIVIFKKGRRRGRRAQD